jgi:poly-gamma-glutamate capsule biosynthesis protein CapA/YwtB (metallophosphatase superfamily)
MKADFINKNANEQSNSKIRMVMGGDVSFDLILRDQWYLGAFRARGEKEVFPYHVKSGGSYAAWGKNGRRVMNKLKKIWNAFKISSNTKQTSAINLSPFVELLVLNEKNADFAYKDPEELIYETFKIKFSCEEEKIAYPFEKIGSFLRNKDFVLINLETPLTRGCRACGFFMSDPGYAKSMVTNGVSMVSLANNHIFDAGEIGFLQTMTYLKDAGIPFTGAADNFEKARLGESVKIKGVNFTFLGYTQFCNARFASIASEFPGILPLDRKLIVEDIKRAKKKADFVFPVLHWGIENRIEVHPTAVEIAHFLIDSGADGIIGHHPHVPQGIEIYKGKPILYSLGNFIFGSYNKIFWSDNYLAEFAIEKGKILEVLLYPISGKGVELFQPQLLSGVRADSLLECLQSRSGIFGTKIVIENHIGYIKIE